MKTCIISVMTCLLLSTQAFANSFLCKLESRGSGFGEGEIPVPSQTFESEPQAGDNQSFYYGNDRFFFKANLGPDIDGKRSFYAEVVTKEFGNTPSRMTAISLHSLDQGIAIELQTPGGIKDNKWISWIMLNCYDPQVSAKIRAQSH